jgi:hypothetical protein
MLIAAGSGLAMLREPGPDDNLQGGWHILGAQIIFADAPVWMIF